MNRDKYGMKIKRGSVLIYMAGSNRHIPQVYWCDGIDMEGLIWKDMNSGREHFRLSEVEKYGSVVGSLQNAIINFISTSEV